MKLTPELYVHHRLRNFPGTEKKKKVSSPLNIKSSSFDRENTVISETTIDTRQTKIRKEP